FVSCLLCSSTLFRSVSRAIEDGLSSSRGINRAASVINDAGGNFDVTETIRELEASMLESSNNLEFEKAALFRDQIRELKRTFEVDRKSTRLNSSHEW